MPRTRNPYPTEFWEPLIALSRAGRSFESLAREYEPCAATIDDWVKQSGADDGERDDRLTSDELEALRKLRRKVKQPRQTWAGFLYLAVVLDAFSRRIIARRDFHANAFRVTAWAMGNDPKAQLVVDAMNMAVTQHKPDNVIHRSDERSRYTSLAFGLRCKEMGVRPSIGFVGDGYVNAMCESFFATLECELLDRRKFKTKAEARVAGFEFIEGWCNPSRRHAALGYKSPINYERTAVVGLESLSP